MFAAERQRAIMEALALHGRITVLDFAQELGVTPETLRKDLGKLEGLGRLRRTHGGAVRVERMSFSTAVTEREGVYDEEKWAIARAAAEQLEDDSTIAVDAGTTTIKLAEAIPTNRRLTVVTYSVMVASLLAGRENIRVHMLGGEVIANSRATVGPWTLEQIEKITVERVFLSVDGINLEHGLTTHNPSEAAVKRALMKAARSTTVLADHSKLGREEFARVAPLDGIDQIITDDGADRALIAELEQRGPQVVLAWRGEPSVLPAPLHSSAGPGQNTPA